MFTIIPNLFRALRAGLRTRTELSVESLALRQQLSSRRVVHFNITEFPSAVWTAQQIIEAFPEDSAPEYMIRDRDGIYGDKVRGRAHGMGIEEVLTAPHSPWQNPYAERLVAPYVEHASTM